MTIPTEQQVNQVKQLLGREPRGLEAIALAADDGMPRVIRVASLVDNKPFPTLFWLVDAKLGYVIDTLEASGLIAQLQEVIDNDSDLQEVLVKDHLAHIQLRNSYMSTEIKGRLQALGFYAVLQKRGIGGIEDFRRIRCLHTWYAAHLIVPNTVGMMLDEHFQSSRIQS